MDVHHRGRGLGEEGDAGVLPQPVLVHGRHLVDDVHVSGQEGGGGDTGRLLYYQLRDDIGSL